MKIVSFTILLALFIHSTLFPAVFTELTYDTNESNGISNGISVYFDQSYGEWGFYDRMSIKYNPSNEPFSDTYYNNYLKNNFRLTRSGEFAFSSWLSTEIFTDENYTTGFIGLDEEYEQNSSVSTGIDAVWSGQLFSIRSENRFIGRNYTSYDLVSGEKADEFGGDIILSGSAALKTEWLWDPFFDFYHFNDMNENNYLSYSDYALGAEYRNMFDRIYLLRFKLSSGYTDLYPGIPYYMQSDVRVTANFGQKWTAVSKLYFRLFTDESFTDVYNGNSFSEVIVQRNFPVNEENYYMRIRTGLIFNPGDNSLIWKSSFSLPFKSSELSGEYKLYPGKKNASFKEHYLSTGIIKYFYNKRILTGYNFGYLIFRDDYSGFIGRNSEMTHKIIFNFTL